MFPRYPSLDLLQVFQNKSRSRRHRLCDQQERLMMPKLYDPLSPSPTVP